MRQGSFVGFVFSPPATGTALLRHAVTSIRPEADAEANFFERRQTPSTLGLKGDTLHPLNYAKLQFF